jgi:hypothetical protein
LFAARVAAHLTNMTENTPRKKHTGEPGNGGQFGTQSKPDSPVILGKMKNQLDTPYPNIPITSNEFAVGTDVESMTCVCGNGASEDGFSSADRSGRLSNITNDPAPDGLSELPDDAFSICNSCGRVIDSDATTSGIKVLGRVDVGSEQWAAARELYIGVNFGE